MKDCCGIFMAFTLHITLKYFSGHYDTICVTSAAKITSPTFWVYTKTTLFINVQMLKMSEKSFYSFNRAFLSKKFFWET